MRVAWTSSRPATWCPSGSSRSLRTRPVISDQSRCSPTTALVWHSQLFIRAALLTVRSRLPDEVAVVFGVEVAATAPVADVAHDLVPVAVDVLALRQVQQLRHRGPLPQDRPVGPMLGRWVPGGKYSWRSIEHPDSAGVMSRTTTPRDARRFGIGDDDDLGRPSRAMEGPPGRPSPPVPRPLRRTHRSAGHPANRAWRAGPSESGRDQLTRERHREERRERPCREGRSGTR